MPNVFVMKWKGAAVVVLLSACAPDKTAMPTNQLAEINPVVHVDELAGRDCFDVKMETWFVAFDKYQEQGEKMGLADAKAWLEAERAFTECSRNASEKLTSRAKE
jgi:hypothetical protein